MTEIRTYRYGEITLRLRSDEVPWANNILANDEYQLRRLIEEGHRLGTIVDVGAHVGTFSVHCARLWPSATILAIEPHPESFALLAENVRPYANVVPIQAAITDRSGQAILCEAQLSVAHRVAEISEQIDGHAPGLGIEVTSLSILDVIQRHQLTRIDLLKLDCEGAEYLILEQLHDSGFLPQVGWIRGEWHSRHHNDRLRESLRSTHTYNIDDNEGHHVGLFIAHRS